jgi:hypothetical protein
LRFAEDGEEESDEGADAARTVVARAQTSSKFSGTAHRGARVSVQRRRGERTRQRRRRCMKIYEQQNRRKSHEFRSELQLNFAARSHIIVSSSSRWGLLIPPCQPLNEWKVGVVRQRWSSRSSLRLQGELRADSNWPPLLREPHSVRPANLRTSSASCAIRANALCLSTQLLSPLRCRPFAADGQSPGTRAFRSGLLTTCLDQTV